MPLSQPPLSWLLSTCSPPAELLGRVRVALARLGEPVAERHLHPQRLRSLEPRPVAINIIVLILVALRLVHGDGARAGADEELATQVRRAVVAVAGPPARRERVGREEERGDHAHLGDDSIGAPARGQSHPDHAESE